MNTYAIPALKEKRAQIDGRIISLKKQITRHQKELASLDATISLFDDTYRIGSIKPKRTRRRAKLIKQGEMGRHIIDALRRAGNKPITSFEAAIAVSHAIGESDDGASLISASVRSNLQYLARRGKIRKVGDRKSTVWLLPENP